MSATVSKFCTICKIDTERRIIKGPVLRPEIRDRQGTIISKEVIEETAHDFAVRLNEETGPGFMHEEFDRGIQIVETWITDVELRYPMEMRDAIKLCKDEPQLVQKVAGGDQEEIVIPVGTWMIAMRVLDDDIWQGVLNGTYKGFSIGGKANIVYEEAA